MVSLMPEGAELHRRNVRLADALIEEMIQAGIDTVFGVPGGTIAPLHDALIDHPHMTVVTTRHEAGAMFAAAGYARATGKLGVVLVTSGPGVLNTVTGLASALCDGLPVLVLSGEVATTHFGKGALQEGSSNHLDIVGVARSLTKMSMQVTRPEAAVPTLRTAMRTALSGRPGPVLLTLPVDVTSRIGPAPSVLFPDAVASFGEEMKAGFERAALALDGAHRPVLFAGSGTRWGNGPARLRRLAERLQCPVMTTPKAKGVFPESHPLSLGVFGHGGHPSTKTYLEDGVDVLLAVGTGMTDPATDGWSKLLMPTQELIRIDVDPLQVGKGYEADLALVGDAAEVLAQIEERLPARVRTTRRFGTVTSTHPALVANVDGPITPQRALWELQQVMPPDTIYTCDIGEHLLFATHFLKVDRPDAWVALTGLASMGASVGTAIGTRLAMRNRPVVALCGDGGFAMMAPEIATAAQFGLPIVVCVLNDERYGMVEIGHESVYGRQPSYKTNHLSVSEVAAGAGAKVIQIRHPGDLVAWQHAFVFDEGVTVIDVRIDPTSRFRDNTRNKSLSSVREAGFGRKENGQVLVFKGQPS